MSTAIPAVEQIPLQRDAEGVIRVGETRVTLDSIVEAFQEGATPEEIAQQYPAVTLADIYAVIGYYLHRKDEVDGYLQDRRHQACTVREENETRFPQTGLRTRLTDRRQTRTNPR